MDLAWIQVPTEYLQALFGYGSAYADVTDVKAEIVSLSREIRLLATQRKRQTEALKRDLTAPAQLAGGFIDYGVTTVEKEASAASGQAEAKAASGPVVNQAAVKERQDRIKTLDKELAQKRRRIKLLKLYGYRYMYLAGIFVVAVMLYYFLRGAQTYRRLRLDEPRPSPPGPSPVSGI